jgi:enolase
VPTITSLEAQLVLDSRGNPTIEVTVTAGPGRGRAAAPSGASTGEHEVTAWPKGGAEAAVERLEADLRPALEGVDAEGIRGVDDHIREADGTPDLSHVGGNTAVATSLAATKAAADAAEQPLYRHIGGLAAGAVPRPMGNVLGGGEHAVGGTDIQEYLAVPLGGSAWANVRANARVHAAVGRRLEDRFPDRALGKGDEGAWVAPLDDEEALELVADACETIADDVGFEIRPALDVAASERYDPDEEVYRFGGEERSPDEHVEWIADLARDYELYSVEDGADEDDWEAWTRLTFEVGDECLVVGDDLFATNPERLQRGLDEAAANAVLVKPNQVGTLSGTIDTVRLAQRHGLTPVPSHRSGETTDPAIAHLAVALGCPAIKTGAVGGERTAKLNELVRIEAALAGPDPASRTKAL